MNKLAAVLLLSLLFVSCNLRNDRPPRPFSTHADTLVTSANPYSPIDVSPMDMSYFPVDYPLKKMAHDTVGAPVMRVIYSRPHKQGREIFGDLLKYGEPWRLGANEASELELFRTVSIQNKRINAGRYIIYCIPYEDKWTIVLNNGLYTWGLKIDSTKDLTRFDIPVGKTPLNLEFFTMVFRPANDGADLVMAWSSTEARLRINF